MGLMLERDKEEICLGNSFLDRDACVTALATIEGRQKEHAVWYSA